MFCLRVGLFICARLFALVVELFVVGAGLSLFLDGLFFEASFLSALEELEGDDLERSEGGAEEVELRRRDAVQSFAFARQSALTRASFGWRGRGFPVCDAFSGGGGILRGPGSTSTLASEERPSSSLFAMETGTNRPVSVGLRTVISYTFERAGRKLSKTLMCYMHALVHHSAAS